MGQRLFQLKDGKLAPVDEKDKETAIGKALEWLKDNQAMNETDMVVPKPCGCLVSFTSISFVP